MKAKHVASNFSEVFGEYGWPDTLLTDNGTCYASHEFKQLMLDISVNHITSSPHYPQSNQLAEKYVQIVKNLFVKAHVSNKWFPATIVHLLDAKRSYLIRTPEGVE